MKALLKIIRQNYGKILLFSAIAVFYFTFGCPIRVFTGIACPGCGMSRALAALLRLDPVLAFEMHPLSFILPLVVPVYFFRKRIPDKILRLLYALSLILLIMVYIIRLNSDSTVVYADFESGMIYKLLSEINIFKN